MPTAEIKNQISEKNIKELLDNAQSLPGIFKAHFFKNTEGTVELQGYQDKMIEIWDKIIESQNKILQNSTLELKPKCLLLSRTNLQQAPQKLR